MRWMQARLSGTPSRVFGQQLATWHLADTGRVRAASSESRGEPKLDKSMRRDLSTAPSLVVDS